MTKSQHREQDPLAPLKVDDFARYFEAVHGRRPFQWQVRLTERVCQGDWPDCIKLPTASGKTAAIDIAVFALAYQAAEANRPAGALTAARRIFFVVDRRIIVNEAFRRARRAARLLRNVLDPGTSDDDLPESADREVLVRVSRWLQHLAGNESAPPLDCFELRGGIYRDDAWVRSPLQPTVLTSTVDQIGSRLLFRGYGVSDRNLPIHAALTANDSLILLDEAHCSKPFSQTMASIARYRTERWAQEPVPTPFTFVQMTATPPVRLARERVFELETSDYQVDPLLAQRHGCCKPVRLELAVGAKGAKLLSNLAKKLAEQATSLANDHQLRKIAVVVNRVAVARQVFNLLQAKHDGRVLLMIGRMRPIDRDALTSVLQEEFGSGATAVESSSEEVEPKFVVATQCLEVGADLDFDGLVSQCASLDALRQRFGRLNRLGASPGARGVIVAAEGDLQPLCELSEDEPLDPIYGNALARTWYWLKDQSDDHQIDQAGADSEPVVDFGTQNLDARCNPLGERLSELLAPATDAPVLMPAHIDMLCQTAPRPTPEPDVAAYLHGPDRDPPEIHVCWRADLDLSLLNNGRVNLEEAWSSAVEACPPSSAECLAVPLRLFRKWLRNATVVDNTSDVLSEATDPAEDSTGAQDEVGEPINDQDNEVNRQSPSRTVLVWYGKRKRDQERSFCVNGWTAGQIRSNDTIVIPAELGGWSLFGYIPNAPPDPVAAAKDRRRTANGHAHGLTDQDGNSPPVGHIAVIDVAEQAFLQSRAQTILRVHPKLRPSDPKLASLFDHMRMAMDDLEADFSVAHWKSVARAIAADNQDAAGGSLSSSARPDSPLQRLIDSEGQIVRYHEGLAWITRRHLDLKQGTLPLSSFGDDNDVLSLTGKVLLKQHLADVYREAQRLTSIHGLPERIRSTVIEAARLHDLGKADPRFQAMLLNKPLSVAYMQQQLWAKSDGANWNAGFELPDQFRHEMLSLELLERIAIDEAVDYELLKHEVVSHHGHARPLAPLCLDESPAGLDLRSFGIGEISTEERANCVPAHRFDSGVADRFWKLNRKYGWWGLAFIESLLRLADWCASAIPGRGDPQRMSFAPRSQRANGGPTASRSVPLTLAGLDGSNPLAFLAALGLFRAISHALPEHCFQMAWTKHQGAWRPSILSGHVGKLSEEFILDSLGDALSTRAEEHPALRLAVLIDARGMRGAFTDAVQEARLDSRSSADWLSCNGSDMAGPESISQLQTTRRDYHAINVAGLVNQTTRDHLRRSLFKPWNYSDPIAGVSLHLEPREDRRHAYQWHMPSGDPTRKAAGGMIGANRLALEAWPLFQSLPYRDKLSTVGFKGVKANNTQFTWPIWSTPVTLAVLPSLLALRELQSSEIIGARLEPMGIAVVFRCSRILVGKTPNLTSPVAILA